MTHEIPDGLSATLPQSGRGRVVRHQCKRSHQHFRGVFVFRKLSQIFLQWLPVVRFPPFSEVLPLSVWKTHMVKNEFRAGALLGEFELGNRVDAWTPGDYAPGLNYPLVRDKLDVSSYDMPPKKGEGATGFPADLR